MPALRRRACSLGAAVLLATFAGAPAVAATLNYEYAWHDDPDDVELGEGRIAEAEAGDFDGDGLDDAFYYAVNHGYFLFSRPGQAPQRAKIELPGVPTDSTSVGDLNGDGRPEVIMGSHKGLLSISSNAQRQPSVRLLAPDERFITGAPALADLDGDGHQDVVTHETWRTEVETDIEPGELVIRYGDGTGALVRTRLIPVGQPNHHRLELGDINGDGHLDLVSLAFPDYWEGLGIPSIRLGDGTGGFRGDNLDGIPRGFASSIIVGDTNGDGRDDVLVLGVPRKSPDSDGSEQGYIYLQGSDGKLAAEPIQLRLLEGAKGYDLIDVDGDGLNELVMLNEPRSSPKPTVVVMRQRDGRLQLETTATVPYASYRPFAPIRYFRDSIAHGDFSGDGVMDVAVASVFGSFSALHLKKTPYRTDVRPPGAPRLVTAAHLPDTVSAVVDFQPPADDGGSPITRYVVRTEPAPAGLDRSAFQTPLALSRRMEGLPNPGRYRFRVQAFNAAGPGPLSELSPEVHVLEQPRISGDGSVREPVTGTAPLRFVVTSQYPALPGGITFDLATGDSTAIAGEDYQATVRTGLHIPEGESKLEVEIPILSDSGTDDEGNEIFYVRMTNISGAANASYEGAGIIRREGVAPMPALTLGSATVFEGSSGVTVMRFPVDLGLPANVDVRFDIATQSQLGAAVPGVDYIARSVTGMVIPAGQTLAWFEVEIVADQVKEVSESFEVVLSNAGDIPVFSPGSTGTILDDDVVRTGVPEAVEIDAEKGYTDRLFSYISTHAAKYRGTDLVTPAERAATLASDPTPAAPFDALATDTAWLTFPVPANPGATAIEVRVLALVESATASHVALHVGQGNAPSAASAQCTRTAAAAAQVCEILLRREAGAPASTFWALARNLSTGSARRDALRLEAGAVRMIGRNQELVATGRARLDGDDFLMRVGWDIPSLLPGQRRLGYLLVTNADEQVIYHEPLRLHRTGAINAPHVLAQGESREVHLAPGAAQDRIVFDVPVNAQSVVFSQQGQGEVSLFASHVPDPSSPVIGPAPPRSEALASGLDPGAEQTLVVSGATLRPGRWYLTPVNRGSTPARITLAADVVRQGARPAFRPGHYFNPERPGHGLFLDFAGDQWLMVWYTYLQDGTPTWYYTQWAAPAADQAQWSVDLLRVTRVGTSLTHAVRVGSATFSVHEGDAGASPKLSFSYNLDGDAGSEQLTRLGDDACPSYMGRELDTSGHWFTPSDTGYGFSAQVLPNTEVYAAYIYDGTGFPRWVIGQKDYDPAVTDVTMQQLSGFCPTCDLVPVQSRVVSSMTRIFNSDSHIDGLPGIRVLDIGVPFAPPVFASFRSSGSVYLLSARKGCQ
ncbi:hypothetical protein E1B00_08035 [Arenimonas terrae]|uniref:Fibronectin type-III domain-containing protein n=1 Tax=Arenimonas terrae TaxID=2546226 RepID=A0A5C4RX77_9GAMM|nr:hypothetical protein E1B00_08035 [Arenimonas terrae]